MKKMRKKGAIGTIVGIIMAVIGFVVIEGVLENVTFVSSLAENTIKPYIVPLGLVGVLAMAGFMAARRR